MSEWKQLLLYLHLCVLEGKKLESTFSNFLTIKILELDFTSLFNHGKNYQHWIVYWSLGKSCVWNLNSVIFKNRYKKAKSSKKLAEQFSVLVLVLASHTSLDSPPQPKFYRLGSFSLFLISFHNWYGNYSSGSFFIAFHF